MGREVKSREHSLDVLRILATLGIIMHHYQQFTGQNGVFWGGKIYFGYLVEFFFILSGFFAWKHVDNIYNEKENYLFCIKKAIRLLPVAIITILFEEVAAVVYHVLFGNNLIANVDISGIFNPWNILMAFAGVSSWFEASSANGFIIWYICILLLCYYIFFFGIRISRRLRFSPYYIFAFMIFLGISGKTMNLSIPFLNSATVRGYEAFFVGVLLARFVCSKVYEKTERLCFVCSVWIITFFTVFYMMQPFSNVNHILVFLYYPSFIVIFHSQKNKRLFEKVSIIGVLGEMTYSMYLLHLPIIILMYDYCKFFDIDIAWGSKRTVLVFVLVTMFFSYILYRFVERPLNKYITAKITELII